MKEKVPTKTGLIGRKFVLETLLCKLPENAAFSTLDELGTVDSAHFLDRAQSFANHVNF